MYFGKTLFIKKGFPDLYKKLSGYKIFVLWRKIRQVLKAELTFFKYCNIFFKIKIKTLT